jgi:hypothetical protein
MIAAHADWSADPRKRWVSIARRGADHWRAEAPVLVGDPASLTSALMREDMPVAFGLDLPLGVPRSFASGREEGGFVEFLRGLTTNAGFFAVAATLDQVSRTRPFYPARGVKGMTRAAHATALGFAGPQDLARWCDRATAERPAGAPVFWTLGANQSGKAAIAAWRDWLAPALAAGAPYAIWPFAGRLHGLLAPGRVALAEVYPAEALRHCGLILRGSKRVQADRQVLSEALFAVMASRGVVASPALASLVAGGFGADAAGEDRFDSVIGLLGLIGVLDGARPDFVPDDPAVRDWEGWVLGQTAMPRA